MRCLGCKAWKDGKCLAGIAPYRSKNERDGIGCASNTRTVEKLLRQNRKTNADRIRAMTGEELAEWLSCNCTGDGYGNSAEDWLDWLKEEVESNDS